jgi:hypothetical protein
VDAGSPQAFEGYIIFKNIPLPVEGNYAYFSTLAECKNLAGFCYQCINDCNNAAGFRKCIMLMPFSFSRDACGTSVGLGGSLVFGEPPGSVPSYYYFLKEPLSKVLDLFF